MAMAANQNQQRNSKRWMVPHCQQLKQSESEAEKEENVMSQLELMMPSEQDQDVVRKGIGKYRGRAEEEKTKEKTEE
jgi:hypothetical protein